MAKRIAKVTVMPVVSEPKRRPGRPRKNPAARLVTAPIRMTPELRRKLERDCADGQGYTMRARELLESHYGLQ